MQTFKDLGPSDQKQKPLFIIQKEAGSTAPEWVAECKMLWREESLCDPEFLELYPKQIRSVVNWKRIDIQKVQHSLKTPGKRNYKSHIVNI